MVGVVDRDVHADLCHCDACVDSSKKTKKLPIDRDEYSPSNTSDNDASIKRYQAVTYKLKKKICQIRWTVCVAVKGRALEKGTNEQNGGELGSEKHLKSLPISLTPAESIGRSQISPFSDIDICTNKNPL